MFSENVIPFRRKLRKKVEQTGAGFELGICQRCHRKISQMKMHQHPKSLYCGVCEREVSLRGRFPKAGPMEFWAIAV